MKKYRGLLLILMFFLFIGNVNAEECKKVTEQDINVFFAGDYSNVPYCSGSVLGKCASEGGKKNLCTSGCYPLTIASVLSSYRTGITPQNVSEYLCSNHWQDAEGVSYTYITTNAAFHNHFNMKIEGITQNINTVDKILSEGKMVLISIKGGTAFSSGFHYMAFALKNNQEQYYIINTGKRDRNGWYSKSVVENLVNNYVNQGMFSIYPTDCTPVTTSNSGSNSGGVVSGGTIKDPAPDNGFGSLGNNENQPDCSTIFVKSNGEYNSFHEFVQGLFTLIKIAAPVLVIILSTIDYMKAIASSSADEIKKATNRTIKRLVIGVLVFFLPYLLDLLFHLFGLYDLSRCGIGG